MSAGWKSTIICFVAGPARTVEFDFDMRADTAMSVASEMVEDLSLSHDDARAIAAAIKQEVKQLTGQAPMFSVVDRSAACSFTEVTSNVTPLGGVHASGNRTCPESAIASRVLDAT